MFKNRDSLDRSDRARRLAETVSIIGPPPAAFLERSPGTLEFWDKNGKNGFATANLHVNLNQWRTNFFACQATGRALYLFPTNPSSRASNA